MKKFMADVSIIVPIFNVEEYLKECMESLMRQTYSSIEVLLIDDGSTDNSGKLCDEFAASDKRVRVIHQKNGGHGKACNVGISKAKGEYVMFCDGDDFYFPNMVEKMFESIKNTDVDVVICGAYAFDNNTLKPDADGYHFLHRLPYLYPNDLYDRHNIIKYAADFPVRCWDKIIKRKWLLKNSINFPLLRSYDDISFHWQVIAYANNIKTIREQLYAYRINRMGSSMTSVDEEMYVRARVMTRKKLRSFNIHLLKQFDKVNKEDMEWLNYKRRNKWLGWINKFF